MNKIAVIIASDQGAKLALTIRQELPGAELYSTVEREHCTPITSIQTFVSEQFSRFDALVFIGALGICVRAIAPCVRSKYTDPAVINIDSSGNHVISVLSGHIGGANRMTLRLAAILGANPVITTQSDNNDLWALDTLGQTYGWKANSTSPLNTVISTFVNTRPVALLLDIKDEGTRFMERTAPKHVSLFYHFDDIDQQQFEALIAVTPYIYPTSIPTLYYRPAILHLGVGCRRGCSPLGIQKHIFRTLENTGLSPLSLKSVSTIDLKKERTAHP